jgi:tyrosyl-tRNA synthetase
VGAKDERQIQPLFLNNYEFYKNMNVLTYLREVGKVLRMGSLLGKEVVANRL